MSYYGIVSLNVNHQTHLRAKFGQACNTQFSSACRWHLVAITNPLLSRGIQQHMTCLSLAPVTHLGQICPKTSCITPQSASCGAEHRAFCWRNANAGCARSKQCRLELSLNGCCVREKNKLSIESGPCLRHDSLVAGLAESKAATPRLPILALEDGCLCDSQQVHVEAAVSPTCRHVTSASRVGVWPLSSRRFKFANVTAPRSAFCFPPRYAGTSQH